MDIEPVWMVQALPDPSARQPSPDSQEKVRWNSFPSCDNEMLEEAHNGGKGYRGEVLVYGRKYVVDMKQMTMRPLYWNEEMDIRPVRRGTYFLKSSNGSWCPYDSEDSKIIEDLYSSAVPALKDQVEIETTLHDGQHKVAIKKTRGSRVDPGAKERGEDFVLEIRQRKSMMSVLGYSIGTVQQVVYRGLPPGGVEAKTKGKESSQGLNKKMQQSLAPQHLVFLVHGIGERMWSKGNNVGMPSLRKQSDDLRESSERLLEELCIQDSEKLKLESVASPEGSTDLGAGFIEFLPVEWYDEVHQSGGEKGEHNGIDNNLNRISLPSIPALRQFANEVLMDIMYYLTPRLMNIIVETVASKMKRMFTTFSKYNPDFHGKVIIMGHSLGTIITYDILKAQPQGKLNVSMNSPTLEVPVLNFEPCAFVACGSPIGVFLTLRGGAEEGLDLSFPTTPHFYNVFHPMDPVAYRLEPLVDKRLSGLPPANVPHKGGDRMHVVARKMKGDLLAAVDSASSTVDAGLKNISKGLSVIGAFSSYPADRAKIENGPAEVKLPRDQIAEAAASLNERVDWALQEHPLDGIHPYPAAIWAHGSYFGNIDLLLFVVKLLEKEKSSLQLSGDIPAELLEAALKESGNLSTMPMLTQGDMEGIMEGKG
ncbi:unnamed protein product [Choristocarpus tenellus]